MHLEILVSIDSCGRRAAGAGAQQQVRLASCCEPTKEAHHRLANVDNEKTINLNGVKFLDSGAPLFIVA